MNEWVIVGGGPHGVHLAIRLLGEVGVDPARLRIVDPGPDLLANWDRCTGNTGMTFLRSPGVHHLDLEAFSLLRFASDSAHIRRPVAGLFTRPYNRPSVGLFREHCEGLIETYGLRDLHVRDRVERIRLGCDAARLELANDGELRSQRVILAVGMSEQPYCPDWAREMPQSCVRHVFDPGFVLDPASLPARVAVVGAGISGAQVALRLQAAGREVTLITRHALRKHDFDSDSGWAGPKNMTGFWAVSDLAARRRMITGARHRGSLPTEVHRAVRGAVDRGSLTLLHGEIHEVSGSGPVSMYVDRTGVEVDHVLLATGFRPRRPGGSLVDDLIAAEDLPCASCGYPVVDQHLRWHPRIFVTGPLAELEVGPVARNLIGARRAAERIVPVARELP